MANSVVTTVILIRHGEKGAPVPNDPDATPLSNSGKDRAQTLIHVVGGSGVKAIYVSKAIRTKETAAPLAKHLKPHLTPLQLDRAIDIKNHILSNHAGKTVLVIGHTNTVPDLIDLFVGGNMLDIDDREFDNLFVVTAFDSGEAGVVKLKYGKPSLPA